MENKTPTVTATLMSVTNSVTPPSFPLGLGCRDGKGNRWYRRIGTLADRKSISRMCLKGWSLTILQACSLSSKGNGDQDVGVGGSTSAS